LTKDEMATLDSNYYLRWIEAMSIVMSVPSFPNHFSGICQFTFFLF